jgi:hypothetical protein
MEPEGSLPHSQVPATCPYPELARSSPFPHIKCNLYLANSLAAAAVSEPDLSIPNTTFHVCFSLLRSAKVQFRSEARVSVSSICQFGRCWAVSTTPKPQAGGPHLVGFLRLLIHYIRRHPLIMAAYEIMWKNIVEEGRPQRAIWRMRTACWLTKATDTFRMCNTYCFSTATMVARTWFNVKLYVHCLTCVNLR